MLSNSWSFYKYFKMAFGGQYATIRLNHIFLTLIVLGINKYIILSIKKIIN